MDTIDIILNSDKAKRVAYESALSRYKKISTYSPYKRHSIKIKINNHELCISLRLSDLDDKGFKLTAQLSDYENILEFCDDVATYFKVAPIELLKAPIKRLDTCLDVDSSFIELFESAFYKRYGTLMYYKSVKNRRTCYFATGKNTVCFYERDFEGHVDNELQSMAPEKIIRFERRHYNKKIPIRTLSQAYFLDDYNPFKSISFEKLDASILNAPKNATTLRNLESYLYNVERYGATASKAYMNTKRNFQNIQKHFTKYQPIDLQTCWKNRLKRFFGDDYQYIKQILNQGEI